MSERVPDGHVWLCRDEQTDYDNRIMVSCALRPEAKVWFPDDPKARKVLWADKKLTPCADAVLHTFGDLPLESEARLVSLVAPRERLCPECGQWIIQHPTTFSGYCTECRCTLTKSRAYVVERMALKEAKQ